MFNFLRKLSKKEAKSLEDCLAQNGIAFPSREEAEDHFFKIRDNDLKEIQSINAAFPELRLDFKAKSLVRFEHFYFNCVVDKKIQSSYSKNRLEELLTQYMRQVFVTNNMAEWAVFENEFSEGKYDLGLMYGYGAGTQEHYAGNLDLQKDNNDRKYLYDKFMAYVPEEREGEVR